MDAATLVPESVETPPQVEPDFIKALREAIDGFRSRAQFTRKLKEQVSGAFKITPAHVGMWLRRKNGVPAYLAPDVEAISGVSVERLRPEVSWHVVRGVAAPKRRRALRPLK